MEDVNSSIHQLSNKASEGILNADDISKRATEVSARAKKSNKISPTFK